MSSTVVKPAARSVCALASAVIARMARLAPPVFTWTWASIMPGITVAWPRSITVAPAGICDGRADVGDAVAADQHHLVRQHGAGAGVEQVPGANGDHLIRRRHESPHLGLRRAARKRRDRRDQTDRRFAVPLHGILPCREPHSLEACDSAGGIVHEYRGGNRRVAAASHGAPTACAKSRAPETRDAGRCRCINTRIPGGTTIRVQRSWERITRCDAEPD